MTTEIWDVIAVITVALRKESVDRNNGFYWWVEGDSVALRKESVDRNMRWVAARINTIASLSARRAWIEISCTRYSGGPACCRSPQGERG